MSRERPTALELGLYALAWGATLAIGSVHPRTQVVLGIAGVALALALGLGPARERGLRLSPVAWVMVAALGWTLLQLVPLPPSLLRLLAPETAELRAEVGQGWAPITLDAPATWIELAKQLAYLGAFLVGVELLRERAATRRASIALALLGLVVAVSLLVHRHLGLQTIYGLYTPRWHPGSGYFAPFVNGNHAASVLGLGALAALGLAAAAQGGPRLAWLGVGTVSAVGVLTTLSRGGALALALGGLVAGSLLAVERFGRRGLLLPVALLVVVSAAALSLSDGLRARLGPGGEAWNNNQKTRGWKVAARLAARYPVTGVGRGAFEAPAAALRVENEGVRLTYAEDVVLQCASEWGIPLAFFLFSAAFFTLATVVRRLPREPEVAGLLGGAFAVAFYGLLDCGFEFPGVLLPFTVALAALVARAEVQKRTRRRPRRSLGHLSLVAGATAAAVVLALGWRATARTLDEDAAAIRAARDRGQDLDAAAIEAALRRHPSSADLEMLAGERALRHQDRSALMHLGRAMRLQPSLARPHELAAIELLGLRKPKQAALEYRLALERGAPIPYTVLVAALGDVAVEAAPRTGESLCQMGMALAAAQRWSAATDAFRRAAELDPGPKPRKLRLDAFAQAPGPVRLAAIDDVLRRGASGEELAHGIDALVGLRAFDRADAVYGKEAQRFADSALLLAAGARARAARGDLDGARRMISKTARFDASGRLVLGELAVQLADQAGDREGGAAARARLHLLRTKADLEQPAGRVTR